MTWIEKAFTLFVNQLRNEVMQMQTIKEVSILNGFPPIQCQHEVSSQSGFLRDQVRCKRQNTCESSTCGSKLVAMSIVRDWISGLWLNWRLLVFLYKDQLIHMMTRIAMKIQKHLLSCYIQIKWALLHFLKDHWNANLRVFILITVSLITVIQARFCPVIRFSFLSSLRGAYTCIFTNWYIITSRGAFEIWQ